MDASCGACPGARADSCGRGTTTSSRVAVASRRRTGRTRTVRGPIRGKDTMASYDAIIIGTGQAGPPLARRLSKAGMKVAIAERRLFGGTCVNTGCIPTKALVANAFVARTARRASEFGVSIGGDVAVDMMAVKARKDGIVQESRSGIESMLRALDRVTVHHGHARFESPREVRVGDALLTAERIFINVGGRASTPPLPGLSEVPYWTNSSMMGVDFIPPRLVVIGGSYVGLEFAQMYHRFGSAVTVVEKAPRLIAREDEDVSDAIREILQREGIEVRLEAECIALERSGSGVRVRVECREGEPAVEGTHVLLAVGRRPNTDDLGLERAGVAVDDRGFVVVDDELRTSVPGIWALGDCNGRGAFTHTSYNDFEIVAGNLLDGDRRKVTDRIEAYALYIDPPLGRAGMTETQARREGRRLLVGRRAMSRIMRAVEKGDPQGFMKIIVDADSKQILGAAILGVGGDEVIHCVLDVMYARAPYGVLRRAMHIHPTVAEYLPTVLGSLREA
jgi:pyruvate/2-oxoglutarate dehydrogenase complex dihydrolipoamide dehydrogenase (E3) component